MILEGFLEGKESATLFTSPFALSPVLRYFVPHAIMLARKRFGATHGTREVLASLGFVRSHMYPSGVGAHELSITSRMQTGYAPPAALYR